MIQHRLCWGVGWDLDQWLAFFFLLSLSGKGGKRGDSLVPKYGAKELSNAGILPGQPHNSAKDSEHLGILGHRAGLNRGVPIGRSTQIMGGSFRRGLHADAVTFST